ncbi:hypothetical protein EXU30_07840 [Shewanella maritima]|uniref:Uncharacterized protein n=1 Tax=Shewanella maritima TaxID=2520507 RepID=A0A411PGC8_9GAMM|nr:hypothetical protein [Shewanella maritima]QBF82613.1 hypothetical protein EXU30_07840 [Shewanella maritima]
MNVFYKWLGAILLLLTNSNVNAREITYILIDEWFANGAYTNSPQKIDIDNPPTRIYEDEAIGLTLLNGMFYQTSAREQISKAGEKKKCNGYQGECFVIKDRVKLFLPANFNPNIPQVWTWENYKYSTITHSKFSLLGRELVVTDIIASCTECLFNNVRFQFDHEIGITSFKVSANGASLRYLLGSKKGFFAKK